MQTRFQGKEPSTKPIWVFGYGSLIHTPNFLYTDKKLGYIKGFRRVFWQGSTDHRGTPERPGRTVTLAADDHPSAATWGVAFQLAGTPEEQAAALSYLEWREKQYDVRQLVDVYDADGEVAVAGALIYIASPANRNYLGPADATAIAAQIAISHGPSGPNCDYLFKLAGAMRSMGVPDPELFALEVMVREELARPGRGETAAAAEEGQLGVVLTVAGMAAVEVEAAGHECFRQWHEMGRGAQRVLMPPLELRQEQQTTVGASTLGEAEPYLPPLEGQGCAASHGGVGGASTDSARVQHGPAQSHGSSVHSGCKDAALGQPGRTLAGRAVLCMNAVCKTEGADLEPG